MRGSEFSLLKPSPNGSLWHHIPGSVASVVNDPNGFCKLVRVQRSKRPWGKRPKESKGMKVGGEFPKKNFFIRDPESYLPSSHLLSPLEKPVSQVKNKR